MEEKKQHKGACHFSSDQRKKSLFRLGRVSILLKGASEVVAKEELTIFIVYLIYLYITMNIIGTLHMPPTFLVYFPHCHSTSIASSAWVPCLLSAYQKIVLLLSETGEKTQLSCLGILYVGIAHTLQTSHHSRKASF